MSLFGTRLRDYFEKSYNAYKQLVKVGYQIDLLDGSVRWTFFTTIFEDCQIFL